MGEILVTGAGGFIGGHLISRLKSAGRPICATSRYPKEGAESAGIRWHAIDDIGPHTDWNAALAGVEVVIHLAGVAHRPSRPAGDARAAFWRTNVYGTEHLAASAAASGVSRLVFVSSIKVNGERTGERPFVETDEPRPEDVYGQSKLEAERRLISIGKENRMDIVIVRPPLVFSHDASGNFGKLLRAVKRGIPLPFSALDNKRSLINVENLVDLLITCAEHPRAGGEIFVVADDEDISTPELVRRLAAGMNRGARLIRVPRLLFRLAGYVVPGGDKFDRLSSSLQVDSAKAQSLLGWHPRIPLHAGLEDAARRFIRASGRLP